MAKESTKQLVGVALQEFAGFILMIMCTFPFVAALGDTWAAWIAHFFLVMLCDIISGGAQVNPSVSVAMMVFGAIPFDGMIVRIIAQVIASIVAFPLCRELAPTYVDIGGPMIPADIEEIISFFKNDPRTHNVNIGFHAHNNSQISMANTLKAIECGVDMIDGTYGGKGRGGGNLPLENIILYLKIRKKYNFDIGLFLDFVYKFYHNENLNIKLVRETIAGFMNIHPYRLDMYEETSNLNILYSELNNLSEAKKKDYKI